MLKEALLTVKECVSFKTPIVEPLISRPTHVGDATLDTSSKMEYASWRILKMSAIPIVILSQMEDARNARLDTISMPQGFVLKLMIRANRSVSPIGDVWNVTQVTNSAHQENVLLPFSQ